MSELKMHTCSVHMEHGATHGANFKIGWLTRVDDPLAGLPGSSKTWRSVVVETTNTGSDKGFVVVGRGPNQFRRFWGRTIAPWFPTKIDPQQLLEVIMTTVWSHCSP